MCDESKQRQVGDGQEQSRANLIVNHLPEHLTHDDVKALFETVGDVVACKVILNRETGESAGYGFITYRRPEEAQAAIKSLHGLELYNKILKVSYVRPNSEALKTTNLYVGSLPLHMTQQDLEAMFRPYGTIISSRILHNNHNVSRGLGFVRFNLRLEAERAISALNGFTPQGATQALIVKFATSSFPSRKTLIPLIHPQEAEQYPAAAAARPNKILYPPPEMMSNLVPARVPEWCLFVHNLAPELVNEDVWRLFGPCGAVRNVQIVTNTHTGKSKGYGFVTMVHYQEACRAIQLLNGCRFANRVLHITFSTKYKQ